MKPITRIDFYLATTSGDEEEVLYDEDDYRDSGLLEGD